MVLDFGTVVMGVHVLLDEIKLDPKQFNAESISDGCMVYSYYLFFITFISTIRCFTLLSKC